VTVEKLASFHKGFEESGDFIKRYQIDVVLLSSTLNKVFVLFQVIVVYNYRRRDILLARALEVKDFDI
jgi:hypothetical protein